MGGYVAVAADHCDAATAAAGIFCRIPLGGAKSSIYAAKDVKEVSYAPSSQWSDTKVVFFFVHSAHCLDLVAMSIVFACSPLDGPEVQGGGWSWPIRNN